MREIGSSSLISRMSTIGGPGTTGGARPAAGWAAREALEGMAVGTLGRAVLGGGATEEASRDARTTGGTLGVVAIAPGE